MEEQDQPEDLYQLAAAAVAALANGGTPLPDAPRVHLQEPGNANFYGNSRSILVMPDIPTASGSASGSASTITATDPNPSSTSTTLVHNGAALPATGNPITNTPTTNTPTTSTATTSTATTSTATTSTATTSTPTAFTFAGVNGYEVTEDGETRFFCIQCGRSLKYTHRNVSSHHNHIHDPNSSQAGMRGGTRFSILRCISPENGMEGDFKAVAICLDCPTLFFEPQPDATDNQETNARDAA
ncbi:hypothetical protein F5B20DRAFT_582060 [Whalleya microplaca]|nr:hypothetical protein F5B20DRAFT_582060 [Whalleya microplaca]